MRIRHTALLFILLSLVWFSACRRSEPEPSPQKEPTPVSSRVPHAAPERTERIELSLGEKTIQDEAGGLNYHHLGNLSEAQGIVVLFHGYGAEGDDLVGLAEEFQTQLKNDQVAYLTPEAPFALVRGRAWFRRDRENFEEGLSYAKAFVRWVRQVHPEARLVVGGFSQGAMITANLLAEADGNFAAALILSPADLLTNEPRKGTPRIPVFMSHGTRDRILPYAGAVSLRDRLRAMNYEVSWTEFVGRHAIPRTVREALVEHLRETFDGSRSQ